ncbi:MAG: hypothetical protein SVY10_11010 [Thermodesulfobacteriota bacterium]|nr:hypothetical protein [Thermodesulfobacteriota bacterium]
MAEMIVYENGEFTEFLGELPLTEDQRDALERFAHNREEKDFEVRGVHRIIVDMDF